jgi:hypothetical protein
MTKLADMPLYPDEQQIAVAVLGAKRARSWPAIARQLEAKDGLPPVEPLFGGRYWPAVVDFFNRRYGLNASGSTPANSRVRIVPYGSQTRVRNISPREE